MGYPSIRGDDRGRLSRAWLALRTAFAGYLRRWRHGARRSAPGPLVGERTTGRHALQAVRRPPVPQRRPESLADHGSPPAPPARRAYPGPRPAWAGPVDGGGGAHRTQDIDYDAAPASRVYDTGVHRLDPSESGAHRSGLYDTGVRRVGTYDSGVHRTDVYQTGVHRLPDDEDGPLYRQDTPRDVGGGRRRLDAQDRRADGRPDLTVIPGDGYDDSDDPGPGRRPGHLRALPGERFNR